jgi:hypothetical protein
MISTFVTSFPAPHGYEVLSYEGPNTVDRKGKIIIEREPIIGFLVIKGERRQGPADCRILPVTPHHVVDMVDDRYCNHNNGYALLRPDGKIELPLARDLDGVTDFASLEAFEQHLRQLKTEAAE